MTAPAIIVIGTSAGGLHALSVVLGGLPPDLDVPIVVVQHRSADSHDLAAVLQDATKLVVEEAEDKVILEDGHVYLAPADYHLLVAPGELALTTDEPIRYSRPSIDMLFESAADSYGDALVAVVLTGANQDGCRGALHVVRQGGRVLVQDPATAESATMPAAVMRSVPEAVMLPLERIAPAMLDLMERGMKTRIGA
jgi:two-component system, chemotaxis family, protein-glutamate methylesterase/glutaminase